MSTLAQGDSIIDISDEILETIETAPIEIVGVDNTATDAVEIKLTNESGTALKTETTGSTVLTGESLEGTLEDPASISLKTDGSKEVQTVIVNTATVSNTVITTDVAAEGETVAAAAIDISAANIEAVSIKTSSTEQKSVVKFDQTTETINGVRVELEGAGGDLSIQTSNVEKVEVKASGTSFSEITFGSQVESINEAQIEIGQAGGSVALEAGTLTSSVIEIASDEDAVNSVNIGSQVESVKDTTIQLQEGSSTIGIASAKVEDLTVVANSNKPTELLISSEEVSGFTLDLTLPKAEAQVNLTSDNKIEDTVFNSSSKVGLTASINAVNFGTEITNTRKGSVDASFSAKSVDTVIESSGKGNIDADFGSKVVNPVIESTGKNTISADFEGKTVGAEIESEKGAVEATFEGKVKDILVNASTSKKSVELSFGKRVNDADLKFGRGSDEVIFGGTIGGTGSTVDLGNDKKEDIVTIEKPKKVESPIVISSFGKQDILNLGNKTFTYDEISEFEANDSYPKVFGDNISVDLI